MKKYKHNFINLVGKVFGRLTVLEVSARTDTRIIFWKCYCNCGRKVEISGSHLRNGSTKSCGCLKLDKKKICKRGHDILICGRTSTNNCRECDRLVRQNIKFKIKRRKYMKRYNKLNRKLIRKRSKKRYLDHPEAVKNQKLKQTFNITLDSYNKMLKEQKYRCAGCRRHRSEFGKAFAVDHDHACCSGEKSCGKCIRGLLCYDCNFILGRARDNSETLKRLAIYVRK